MENNIQRNGDDVPKDRPAAPPVPIIKTNGNGTNQPQNSNTARKEKRMNSSRYNVSKNRELSPLPRLTGMFEKKKKRNRTKKYFIAIFTSSFRFYIFILCCRL